MDFNEKKLYHQIHPLNSLTDWIAGSISLYFLWIHQIPIELIVMLVPLIVVSLLIVNYVVLERLRDSSFGKYIQKNMTGVWR